MFGKENRYWFNLGSFYLLAVVTVQLSEVLHNAELFSHGYGRVHTMRTGAPKMRQLPSGFVRGIDMELTEMSSAGSVWSSSEHSRANFR